MIYQKLHNTIGYIYLTIITYSLLIPLDSKIVTNVIKEDRHPDNTTSFFIHFILFFVLYLTCYRTLKQKYKILILCVLYSIIIECLQIITNRGFQIFDIFFNIIGVISSYFLLMYFNKGKKWTKILMIMED